MILGFWLLSEEEGTQSVFAYDPADTTLTQSACWRRKSARVRYRSLDSTKNAASRHREKLGLYVHRWSFQAFEPRPLRRRHSYLTATAAT